MADLEQLIDIVLHADLGELERVVDGLGRVEQQGSRVEGGLKKGGDAAVAFGRGLLGGVAGGILLANSIEQVAGRVGQLTARFVAETAALERANVALASHAGLTRGQATEIAGGLVAQPQIAQFPVGEQVQALSSVAGMLALATGRTLDFAQAQQVMGAASALAVSSEMGLAAATQTLVQVTSTFGGQYADNASLLHNAAELTGTSVDAIGTAALRVHDRLGAAAPSLSSILQLMVQMSQAGLSGQRGMLMVSSAITQMYSGAPSATAALRSLRIELYNDDQTARDASEVLAEVAAKLRGLPERQRIQIETQLFGPGGGAALDPVLANWQTNAPRVAAAVNNITSAQEHQAEQTKTLAGQWTMLWNTIRGGAQIAVSKPGGPLGGATDLLRGMNEGIKQGQMFEAIWDTLGRDLRSGKISQVQELLGRGAATKNFLNGDTEGLQRQINALVATHPELLKYASEQLQVAAAEAKHREELEKLGPQLFNTATKTFNPAVFNTAVKSFQPLQAEVQAKLDAAARDSLQAELTAQGPLQIEVAALRRLGHESLMPPEWEQEQKNLGATAQAEALTAFDAWQKVAQQRRDDEARSQTTIAPSENEKNLEATYRNLKGAAEGYFGVATQNAQQYGTVVGDITQKTAAEAAGQQQLASDYEALAAAHQGNDPRIIANAQAKVAATEAQIAAQQQLFATETQAMSAELAGNPALAAGYRSLNEARQNKLPAEELQQRERNITLIQGQQAATQRLASNNAELAASYRQLRTNAEATIDAMKPLTEGWRPVTREAIAPDAAAVEAARQTVDARQKIVEGAQATFAQAVASGNQVWIDSSRAALSQAEADYQEAESILGRAVSQEVTDVQRLQEAWSAAGAAAVEAAQIPIDAWRQQQQSNALLGQRPMSGAMAAQVTGVTAEIQGAYAQIAKIDNELSNQTIAPNRRRDLDNWRQYYQWILTRGQSTFQALQEWLNLPTPEEHGRNVRGAEIQTAEAGMAVQRADLNAIKAAEDARLEPARQYVSLIEAQNRLLEDQLSLDNDLLAAAGQTSETDQTLLDLRAQRARIDLAGGDTSQIDKQIEVENKRIALARAEMDAREGPIRREEAGNKVQQDAVQMALDRADAEQKSAGGIQSQIGYLAAEQGVQQANIDKAATRLAYEQAISNEIKTRGEPNQGNVPQPPTQVGATSGPNRIGVPGAPSSQQAVQAGQETGAVFGQGLVQGAAATGQAYGNAFSQSVIQATSTQLTPSSLGGSWAQGGQSFSPEVMQAGFINNGRMYFPNDSQYAQLGQQAAQAYGQGLQQGAQQIPPQVAPIQDLQQQAATGGEQVGVSLGAGIAMGISSSTPMIASAAASAISEAINAGKQAAGIASPSRRAAAELGSPFVAGIAGAILAGASSLTGAVRSVMGGALAAGAPSAAMFGFGSQSSGSQAAGALPSGLPAMMFGGHGFNIEGDVIIRNERDLEVLGRQQMQVAERMAAAARQAFGYPNNRSNRPQI